MSDTVERIKSRLDIVDVVSGYLKVQKAGANWKARCPFHNEKTPSFHISPERQSWHCFGCNKGGDMFSFVQEIEGVEFVESMRILAAKAGVEIAQYRPQERAQRDERERLLGVAERSAAFFSHQLWNGAAGNRALAYLRERGLTDDTIKAWRLGWAPNDWQALTGFLAGEGHVNHDIVAAGMAVEKAPSSASQVARIYDRFRSRIMFPITDGNGQVVGFTGRVFGAEVAVNGEPLAKYVNTPQTAIYDKSRVLFGLEKAKLEMRKRDACLLVEGNMDAIASWQAGAMNVVATSGTALTPAQLRLLGRYSANLDFCFDTDQAGQAATRRGIGLALAANFAVRIVSMSDAQCKDPAEYVAKHGAKWNDVVATAKPALQYYYDTAVAGYDPNSALSKKDVIRSLGPLVKRLVSNVERSHWVGQLATLLRTDAVSVTADIAAVKDDIAAYERTPEPESATDTLLPKSEPIDLFSRELLTLVVREPSLLPQAAQVIDLCDARVAAILREPAKLQDAEGEERRLIDMAHIRAGEFYSSISAAQIGFELSAVVARLRERDLRNRRAQIELDIRQAEQARDPERLAALVAQFQHYTEELNRLQSIQSPTTTA
jgi:DNA primase